MMLLVARNIGGFTHKYDYMEFATLRVSSVANAPKQPSIISRTKLFTHQPRNLPKCFETPLHGIVRCSGYEVCAVFLHRSSRYFLRNVWKLGQ